MTLLDALARTHWHVARAARDGVPTHRRLEQATMTEPINPDIIDALIDRLEAARNQARRFGLSDDDKASDIDRANALRRGVDAATNYSAAMMATALDDLPDLSREAQAMIRALQERTASKDAEIARLKDQLAAVRK